MPSLTILNLPVGSVIDSMLTESQFQGESHVGWVLADGRSVVGSRYASITGAGTIPDLRGVYTRGKDNGRGLDPDGDPALGNFRSDQVAAHTHTTSIGRNNSLTNGNTDNFVSANATGATSVYTSSSTGGNETRPKTVVVNKFIRIN